MGAATFFEFGKGRGAEEAFQSLVSSARHEHGHGGYTGTIAEKRGFVIIPTHPGTVEGARERLLASAREQIERIRTAPLKNWEICWIASEEDRAKNLAEAQAKVDALMALPKGQLNCEIALAVAEDLIEHDNPAIRDKWGPAGCIVIRNPDVVRPIGKAKAQTLAKKKWGETADVEVKVIERASKANGGKRTVLVTVTTVSSKAGWGMNETVPGGWKNTVASAVGSDEKTACGNLFAEPGEYLFFGWASS